jgi:oxygen-dependent protoporphyrinogen oxidase
MPTAEVAIVGGGISGLSAAWYLAQAGIRAALFERRGRLGGVITTEVVDGCLIEGGPDSFLSAKPWAMELIRELGLASEVIGSNDHLRLTYLWKGGRLVPLPDGLMLMVPTRVLPLITTRAVGWRTKLRMGLEWFRPAAGASPQDRTVADFVREHYGQEAVDYLAEPLLAGVYGGRPEELSVTSVLGRFVELEARYGSLTRGVLAERRRMAAQGGSLPLFQTLRGGLGRLVEALAEAIVPRVEVHYAQVEALERILGGWRLRVNGAWLPFRDVVLACPAYEAARLLWDVDRELATGLGEIPYSSSMTVALVYDSSRFPHPLNGFGFLVPKKERRRLVACTWVGTKFAYRVPPERVLLRCFLGGRDDPAILEESDETVVAMVQEELAEIMGIRREPLFHRVRRWPASMAQYTLGHQERLRRVEDRLEALGGLYLAGNGYQGIGIPDCVRSGKEAANRIVARYL